jgi:hypothetical protein
MRRRNKKNLQHLKLNSIKISYKRVKKKIRIILERFISNMIDGR